jgi:hypothetical protein
VDIDSPPERKECITTLERHDDHRLPFAIRDPRQLDRVVISSPTRVRCTRRWTPTTGITRHDIFGRVFALLDPQAFATTVSG